MQSRSWGCALVVGLLLVPVGSAAAFDLFSDDEFRLRLQGVVEAGYRFNVEGGTDDELEHGVTLNFARLKAQADYADVGGLFLQFDALTASVRPVDLVAWVDPTDYFSIRVGRFKTPVSLEYQVSGSRIRFARRAALSRLVFRRRLGAELLVHPTLGDTQLELRSGLFMPSRLELLDENPGEIWVVRARVALANELLFHAAYADHLFAENSMAPASDGDEPTRIVDNDQQLDVAVNYTIGALFLHLEALIVFDPPSNGTDWAGYFQAAYAINEGAPTVFEPALGFDIVDQDTRWYRMSAVLNTYLMDSKFVASVDYQLDLLENDEVHEVNLRLQASF